MNRKVEKIINIIFQIADWSVPGNRYKGAYNRLRKLTSEIWNDFHAELLCELGKMDVYEMKADYQRLWFDSLGFPPLIPKMYDLEGKQMVLSYGRIPSDFNNICFHDSVIKGIEYREDLTFNLDLFEFWEQDERWYQDEYDAELRFYNVEAILFREYDDKYNNFKYVSFDSNRLLEKMIMSFTEIPSIDYVFNYLEIDKKYHFKDKRMFLLSLCMGSDDEIIIFADGWKIGKDKKNL